MQPEKTNDAPVPQPVEPTPLDKAEDRSQKAWDDADTAVQDLKKLGHDDDPSKDEIETP